MKMQQKKNFIFLSISLIALIGSYNALIINSNSGLADAGLSSLKRIDEVYGVVKVGRQLAVASNWSKVPETKIETKVTPDLKQLEVVPVVQDLSSAVPETLNMKLVEVMNPKKWEKGVQSHEFNGSIATNNGIIESLKASLPEGLSVDISFSEMTGNTFEYDLNGEVYAGLMYQVDQNSYMVTLTNGPLEGTRMRFQGESEITAENYLAENHQVEIGEFGSEETVEPTLQAENQSPSDTVNFNFSTTEAI